VPHESDKILTFVLDLSAQKEAESLALKATEAKSVFLANISHGKSFVQFLNAF
jgi:hypothetical protein